MNNIIFYLCVDILIFSVYIFSIVKGYKTGFLVQIIKLFGIFVSIFLALYFSVVLKDYINLWPKSWSVSEYEIINNIFYDKLNHLAWFVCIFIVSNLLFKLLKPVIKTIQKFPLLKQISGLLGMLISFIITTFWIIIICIVLNMPLLKFDTIPSGKDIISNTLLKPINEISLKIVGETIIPILEQDKFNNLMKNFNNLDNDDRDWVRDFLEKNNIKDISIEDMFNGN